MITQKYKLNLIPDKVPVIVNCSQFDALSRTILFDIYDGNYLFEISSGTTATVRGTKSDNTGFEYPCEIDGSNVSFAIKDQMTVFDGRVPCEIRLADSDGIIGTCNFLLNVEKTPLDPNVTISETDLPLLEEAEQNAIRAEQAAEEAVQVLSTAVKSVNDILPDANGNVDVDAVYSVNNVAPDSSGNVDIVALPTGGTQGQFLVKQSSADGDADWETEDGFLYHGDEVGDLPTPINADQLEGHPASYFQPLLTAGEGISIASNVISSNVITETPTTTNGNIQSSNIIARKIGDVLFLSGYIVAASNQTFTGDSTVCFTVSERPSGNRFFTFQNYTSNGPIVYVAKLNTSGNVVFNNTVTVATTYLFFNAALPL